MKKLVLLLCLLSATRVKAQEIWPLYSGAAPGNTPCDIQETGQLGLTAANVTTPTLAIFKPVKQDKFRGAVLIIPGGGYQHLAMGHEGYGVAKAFNDLGITAFVLKYRLPNNSSCFDNKELMPLMDAQRAMLIIRNNAKKTNINPRNIGVLGFSAGGHLAATLITKFDQQVIKSNGTSLRPDWAVLGYPVISMHDSITHAGSKKNLLGEHPDQKHADVYSADLHVTKKTPPCFIFHAQDDKVVPIKNSIAFYDALRSKQVTAELHVFQNGGHGFGLNNPTTNESWFEELISWLNSNHQLNYLILTKR